MPITAQNTSSIQRIGQPRAEIHVANLPYAGTYEDEVYGALLERFEDIFKVPDQLPNSFEDDWVDAILRDRCAVSMFPSRVAPTRPRSSGATGATSPTTPAWTGRGRRRSCHPGTSDIEEFMRKGW